MANMRIVYDNAAKRASSINADGTLNSLPATNMLTDLKSEVWRGNQATTRTLSFTWASYELVACVVIPFCSLSPSATVRVRGYSAVDFTGELFDTGAVNAVPPAVGGINGVTGVNAYSFGGAASAVVYFTPATVRSMRVYLADPTNPLGYIEVAYLMIGNYFSPKYNVQYGDVQLDVNDTSKHERSESGDLHTDRGVVSKAMTVNLQHMPAADRDSVWRILRGNGMATPVYISVSPEGTDTMEEQILSICGKLSKGSSIQYQFLGQFQTSLQVEEL